MLFNSITFLVFFSIVYALYLSFSGRVRWQNLLLLVSSYVFYGWWDWRFLSLIIISTLADFIIGIRIGELNESVSESGKKRKSLLIASVAINLTILGFFKYFNFFSESFIDLWSAFGFRIDSFTLNIVLPVGISFYTFQTMSYTIDIYRKRLQPTKNIINFAVFVAFFPQLVAGPIERAKNLLPQVEKPRNITMEQINVGIYLILWGYFKKVVVADNCGRIADLVFNSYTQHPGLDLLIGTLAFAFQIYGDFSGYSDIARGLARLMGFEIMVNFRLPYFALNPSDFWQRWHISLSSWLRDYLYISLGGNKRGSFMTYRNLALTMLLGGLWHGAAWNFVVWGGFHGLILILYRVFEKRPAHENPWGGEHSYFIVIMKMVFMFGLTLVGWILFRSNTIHQIIFMLTRMSLVPSIASAELARQLIFFSAPLVAVQIYQYVTSDLLILLKQKIYFRIFFYCFLLLWIFVFGIRDSVEFIYFQF